jgi:hypothetical protein
MNTRPPPLTLELVCLFACVHNPPPGQVGASSGGYLLTSDSARLFYQIAGHGRDTIIALHGGPGDNLEGIAEDFTPLTVRHAVVFYDQRGGGKSELPRDTTRLFAGRQVEDLEELRDLLRLDRVTLIAHPMVPSSQHRTLSPIPGVCDVWCSSALCRRAVATFFAGSLRPFARVSIVSRSPGWMMRSVGFAIPAQMHDRLAGTSWQSPCFPAWPNHVVRSP